MTTMDVLAAEFVTLPRVPARLKLEVIAGRRFSPEVDDEVELDELELDVVVVALVIDEVELVEDDPAVPSVVVVELPHPVISARAAIPKFV